MSESEPYRKSSWWIRSKERPDISHIKDWPSRLRAGEEAIFHNFRITKKISDHYLAVIKSPKAEATIVNYEHLRVLIDTDSFAQIRSSHEFGEEFPGGGKTLLLPPTAKLIAVGIDQIQQWIGGSAYLQDVYTKLKQRLKPNLQEIYDVA